MPRHVVDHVRRDVKLQQLGKVLEHVCGSSAILVLSQGVGRTNNLDELVREVVLRPPATSAVHANGRAHGERRNGKHADDEPLGSRPLGIEAKRDAVVVRDSHQDVARASWGDGLLEGTGGTRLVVVVSLRLPLRDELLVNELKRRLACAAPATRGGCIVAVVEAALLRGAAQVGRVPQPHLRPFQLLGVCKLCRRARALQARA